MSDTFQDEAPRSGIHTQSIPDVFADDAAERLERRTSSDQKLSDSINAAIDAADKPDEFEQFVAARPEREELKARHGVDAAGVIQKFSHYETALRQNPRIGVEVIQSDYLAGANLATLRHAEQSAAPKGESRPKPDEEEFSGVKLDRIIENALDEHMGGRLDADKAEFEKAQPLFAEMKARNPSLTIDEFFKSTVHADRELWKNPNFAHRLAGAAGAPITALQQETAQVKAQTVAHTNQIENVLTDMESRGELLDLERYAPAMAKIMALPNFVRTADLRSDVRRANRIAELHELAAMQDAQKNQSVEKAKRAAPIVSRGAKSVAQSTKSNGLDGAIAAAMGA